MYENNTLFSRESTPHDVGAVMFWLDECGHWQTVEVIDSEPRGFGFATVQWHDLRGTHTRNLPSHLLCDLDTYLDQCGEYSAFELATTED